MKADGARILVVGGILRMQAALAVTLRDHCVVTTASTASEGLHRLRGSRPDLVVLDSCLPDLKSVTFLRALRAHRPDCQVILLAEGEGMTSSGSFWIPAAIESSRHRTTSMRCCVGSTPSPANHPMAASS